MGRAVQRACVRYILQDTCGMPGLTASMARRCWSPFSAGRTSSRAGRNSARTMPPCRPTRLAQRCGRPQSNEPAVNLLKTLLLKLPSLRPRQKTRRHQWRPPSTATNFLTVPKSQSAAVAGIEGVPDNWQARVCTIARKLSSVLSGDRGD